MRNASTVARLSAIPLPGNVRSGCMSYRIGRHTGTDPGDVGGGLRAGGADPDGPTFAGRAFVADVDVVAAGVPARRPWCYGSR
jgi:hypothetical protein